MDRPPLAARLALPLRLPAASAGGLAALLVPLEIAGLIPSPFIAALAIGLAVPTAVFFLIAVFDRRFQNAVSALNSERRAAARALGWRARLFGWGLPGGDRALIVVRVVLLGEAMTCAFLPGHSAAAGLAVAAFALATLLAMALMARPFPAAEFKGLFT